MITIDFDRFNLEDGDRVLDLGCGAGWHALTSYMLKNLQAFGVDRSCDDLKTALQRFQAEIAELDNSQKRFYLCAADALSLPFVDNCFDKIICTEVLEHIFDYKKALQEIARVLKPTGMLAVSVPRFVPEWICWKLSKEYHNVEGGHVQIFKAAQLCSEIEKQGMICYCKHWAHSLHAPYWWLQCLLWKNREHSPIIKAYHRFLLWDLSRKPKITHILDRILNPLMGKSVVMYFKKDKNHV